MGVPLSQMWTVASYVLKQKINGRKQYPLVLMLEPCFAAISPARAAERFSTPLIFSKRISRPNNASKRWMSAARRWFPYLAANH